MTNIFDIANPAPLVAEHLLLALLEHEHGSGVLSGAGVGRQAAEDFVTGELARESADHGRATDNRA